MLLVDGLHVHGIVDTGVATAATLIVLAFGVVCASWSLVIPKVASWKLEV